MGGGAVVIGPVTLAAGQSGASGRPAVTGRSAQALGEACDYRRTMPIARHPSTVLDCPDPAALAAFYARMLDWRVETNSDDEGEWVDIRGEERQCISFQKIADYRAPRWPDPDAPQQMHLDVVVDDLDEAETAAVELGATRATHQPGTTFRVMVDPAGHPFCLCLS